MPPELTPFGRRFKLSGYTLTTRPPLVNDIDDHKQNTLWLTDLPGIAVLAQKTFSPRFKSEPVPAPLAIPTPPYETLAAVPLAVVTEGRMVYTVLQCWSCHGGTGKGNGASASSLVDDWGTPIRPFNFTSGGYKFGDSPADVYRTFNTGLNGTPMPSYYDAILYPQEAFSDLSSFKTQVAGKPV